MIKIRLVKIRAKHVKFYRIVAIDKSSKVNGKPQDIIGTWDPIKKVKVINKERLDRWLQNGAVLSRAVAAILEV